MVMKQEDIARYKKLYLQTAREYMTKLDENVSLLLSGEAQDMQQDLREEIHRGAHSLKSQSILMGYTSIGEVCAIIERFFEKNKEKELPSPQETLKAVDAGVKKMITSLNEIEQHDQEIDLATEITQLQKILTL